LPIKDKKDEQWDQNSTDFSGGGVGGIISSKGSMKLESDRREPSQKVSGWGLMKKQAPRRGGSLKEEIKNSKSNRGERELWAGVGGSSGGEKGIYKITNG